jgi:hypothetical protein
VRGKLPKATALEIKSLKTEEKTEVPQKAVLENLNVLAIGDSMMVSLAPAIKKKIVSLGGHVNVDARVSTGLARPDVFDWPTAVKSHAAKGRFDYIVVVLGTNDGQDFATNGVLIPYGSKAWVEEYMRRIQAMMATTCEGVTKKVLWLGLPPMRKQSFNRKINRINSWIKRQSHKFTCVEYHDLKQLYGDENGRFIAYKDIEDRLEKVRTSDGIHITRTGGQILSEHLSDRMISH